MRVLAAVAMMLMLAACGQPEEASIEVLMNATTIDEKGATTPYAVVIIEKGKIRAAGTQVHTPIPAGSRKVDFSGMTIRPAEGSRLAAGEAANLDVADSSGQTVRRMRGGRWQ